MPDYEELAKQHQLSVDAVKTLAHAIAAGQGKMAQFNHPELGGMGQWMPGMVMIGDIFNNSLKGKVTSICETLAGTYQAGKIEIGLSQPTNWWPDSYGAPTSTGTQNNIHYAIFAAKKRLIIKRDDELKIYDTGIHHITGVSQQQQNDKKSLIFHTTDGVITENDLKPIES